MVVVGMWYLVGDLGRSGMFLCLALRNLGNVDSNITDESVMEWCSEQSEDMRMWDLYPSRSSIRLWVVPIVRYVARLQ